MENRKKEITSLLKGEPLPYEEDQENKMSMLRTQHDYAKGRNQREEIHTNNGGRRSRSWGEKGNSIKAGGEGDTGGINGCYK